MWYNFVLKSEFEGIEKESDSVFLTGREEDDFYLILFQSKFYSFGLFKPLKDSYMFKGYDYILYGDENTGILIKPNSLFTQYKIACFKINTEQ